MTINTARLLKIVPQDYSPPPFPSLHNPTFPPPPSRSLYFSSDIWRFTVLWTVILYVVVHLVAGVAATALRPGDKGVKRKGRWARAVGVPVVFVLVGAVEAVLAGSVTGLILAAVYNAGPYRMSTWIPFVWGCINILVLILSSFSLQGGL